jgi:hypothetical protein
VNSVILSFLLVLAVIFAVPFAVYGLASAVVGLKTPEGASPARFLMEPGTRLSAAVIPVKERRLFPRTSVTVALDFFLKRRVTIKPISADPREFDHVVFCRAALRHVPCASDARCCVAAA